MHLQFHHFQFHHFQFHHFQFHLLYRTKVEDFLEYKVLCTCSPLAYSHANNKNTVFNTLHWLPMKLSGVIIYSLKAKTTYSVLQGSSKIKNKNGENILHHITSHINQLSHPENKHNRILDNYKQNAPVAQQI